MLAYWPPVEDYGGTGVVDLRDRLQFPLEGRRSRIGHRLIFDSRTILGFLPWSLTLYMDWIAKKVEQHFVRRVTRRLLSVLFTTSVLVVSLFVTRFVTGNCSQGGCLRLAQVVGIVYFFVAVAGVSLGWPEYDLRERRLMVGQWQPKFATFASGWQLRLAIFVILYLEFAFFAVMNAYDWERPQLVTFLVGLLPLVLLESTQNSRRAN